MKKMMALLFATMLSGAMAMPVFAAGHKMNNTNAQTAQNKKKKKQTSKKKKKGTTPPSALYR